MDKYLELGQIVNTRGLKGEVRVNSFTDDNTKFEKLPKIFIKQNNSIIEHKVQKIGFAKNQVIIKFEDINSIEEAEKYRNAYIVADRDDLGELPEGVYYIADLIGLEVYTENNEYLGKVDDIYNTGSNDIYVVKDDLGRQKLLPGIDEVIKKVDIDAKKITVNLIKGLI